MSTLQTTNLKHPDAAGNQITFTSGGDVNFDNGAVYLDSTNNRLGIGTTSPSGSLVVSNSGAAGLEFFPATFEIQAYNRSTSSYGLARYNAAGHQFAVSGIEKARIDTSGRLLVGESSSVGPNNNLQLVGTTNDEATITCWRSSSDAGSGGLNFIKTRGSVSSPTVASNGDSLGIIRWHAYDGSTWDGRAAQIEAEVDGGVSSGDTPGRLVFSTCADGASSPTEQLRITNGGFIKGSSAKGLQLNGYYVSLDNTWRDLDDWSTVANKAGGGSILALTSNHTGTSSGKISLTHHYIRYNGGIGHTINVKTQFTVELRTDSGKLQAKGFDSGTGLSTQGYITLIYSDSRQHIDN